MNIKKIIKKIWNMEQKEFVKLFQKVMYVIVGIAIFVILIQYALSMLGL